MGQVLVNAVTIHVGTRLHFSDFPTNPSTSTISARVFRGSYCNFAYSALACFGMWTSRLAGRLDSRKDVHQEISCPFCGKACIVALETYRKFFIRSTDTDKRVAMDMLSNSVISFATRME